MTAKQTCRSASLVALLLALPVTALADPDDVEPVQRAGEVHDEALDAARNGNRVGDATPSESAPTRKPTGRFQIGVGFSTDENFIAAATIAQDDLFHTGQRLALTTRISAKHQLFLLDHALPLGDGVELHTQLYARDEELPGFRRKAAGGFCAARGADRRTPARVRGLSPGASVRRARRSGDRARHPQRAHRQPRPDDRIAARGARVLDARSAGAAEEGHVCSARRSRSRIRSSAPTFT